MRTSGRPKLKAIERETLRILKIDSGGIFNNLDDATSNIIRLLSNRCVLESLTVRSRDPRTRHSRSWDQVVRTGDPQTASGPKKFV